jgi:hypothetical protein
MKTAYAAALMAAAASGSLLAMANSASAEAATGSLAAGLSQAVTLSSEAKIERTEKAADGSERIVYKSPKEVKVIPGDKVVFTLNYVNSGAEPAVAFRATNPMPGPVQFIEAAEDWAQVSVDGGKTFGLLKDLTKTERIETAAVYDENTGKKLSDAVSEDRTRPARAEDVTHVRWVFATAIQPGQKGSLSYRGLVK